MGKPEDSQPPVDRLVHTPGPWRVGGAKINATYGNCREVCADDGRICLVYGISDPEPQGNARIIAAAPGMRKLIEELYDAIQRGVGPMAGASDSEIGEVINDTMSNLFGNHWRSVVWTTKITGAVLDIAKERLMEQPEDVNASCASPCYASLPSITRFECRCFHCGSPFLVPIKPEYENPMHVMLVEEQQRVFRKHIAAMGDDLMQLARECVDAGVRPEILRRADRLREILDEWMRSMGDA
jgi:hypothetical protein